MAKLKTAHSPLILRAHRLMDAFARADDERDFYLDRQEGFLLYVDLDRPQEDLDKLQKEVEANAERYAPIPKLTLYETRKIMESFTNEKVYDIDTKEKLLDLIQGKDAREQFLEFLHDHHNELDKWQQFYQERFRIRIIEWLRDQELRFVFEEDLELPISMVEKLKKGIFQAKVARDLAAARKTLEAKAETYYSSEALNPRPKRGRPPKHQAKVEVELRYAPDVYTTVASPLQPFLFVPEITNLSSITFSSKYDSEEEFLASLRASKKNPLSELEELSKKLASLRSLSTQVMSVQAEKPASKKRAAPKKKAAAPAPNIEPANKPNRMRRLLKRVKPTPTKRKKNG